MPSFMRTSSCIQKLSWDIPQTDRQMPNIELKLRTLFAPSTRYTGSEKNLRPQLKTYFFLFSIFLFNQKVIQKLCVC